MLLNVVFIIHKRALANATIIIFLLLRNFYEMFAYSFCGEQLKSAASNGNIAAISGYTYIPNIDINIFVQHQRIK